MKTDANNSASIKDNQNNSWSFTSTNQDATKALYLGWDNTKGLQFGSGSAPVKTLTIKSQGFIGKSISKVTINTSCASSGNATVNVKVGNDAFKNGNNESYKLTTTATDVNFTGNAVGEIEVSFTNSAKKAIYLKSIVIEYTATTELGEIKYNGETADGKTFTVMGGTEMKFTAANAETMSRTVNNETPYFANGSEISWTAPVVEEATEYSLTVKAGKSSPDSDNGVSVAANFTVIVTPAPKAETYTLVTSADAIAEGLTYIIAGDKAEGGKFALMSVDVTDNKYFNALMGTAGETYGFAKSDNTIAITPIEGANANKIAIITLEGNSTDGFKIKNQNGNYLKMGSDKTTMSLTDKASDATMFTISLTDGVLTINGGGNTGIFSYNPSYPRFSNYSASQGSIFLYCKTIAPDAPALHSDVETDNEGVITGSTLKFEDVPEGHSIWWRIVPEVAETPADGMVKEEAEFQKYTEPVTLTAGTKGTLHYYAQHDATGGKSETKTAKVNVPDEDTGIAGIEAENGETVYFNLQGVRVQNPEKGIFIRVQNGKAVKITK